MRLRLIVCEIFYREICDAVSRSPHTVDVEFLPKGLHDIGSGPMLDRLQTAVDGVDASRYETLLLGYGLCNNGIAGLRARALPIVIPRAHDCIALFMGSRNRYLDYFNANPGVYFKTSGWIERGSEAGELRQISIMNRIGLDRTFEDLVAKYGEDNARFLWDQIYDTTRNYSRLTYIEMGVGPDERFEREMRGEAERRGWTFEKIPGDMRLLRRLVEGPWNDEDFLTLEPGQRVRATYDETIISGGE